MRALLSTRTVPLFVIFTIVFWGVMMGHAADDPLNSTYFIESEMIRLIDGRCEKPAAPGSAMKVKAAVVGRPAVGDLDADGDPDAFLLLRYDPGGSGTFYYAAAAINEDGKYIGSEAIFLGDRIEPKRLGLFNGVAVVHFFDRKPDESMSTAPSICQRSVSVVKEERFIETARLNASSDVLAGWATVGHEVRSFKPCDGKESLWLMGPSTAMQSIRNSYRERMPNAKPYQPVLMVLAGQQIKSPPNGFGADYPAAFWVDHLVPATPGDTCERDVVFVSEPLPGS